METSTDAKGRHLAQPPAHLESVCVFCGSSMGGKPIFEQVARELGAALAQEDLRLVYGGGGVGLMGTTARAAHEAGGRVLGIMPDFLRAKERLLDEVETVVVETMHERKAMMYDASEAFVVLPGGIGTLEEAIELMSWRRLNLHLKPIWFVNTEGFWDALIELFHNNVSTGMTPDWFLETFEVVDDVPQLMASMKAWFNR
ncbi:MAG: TIGR00730 family Rossman fold protein [Caulobacterales bacterium]|nr:TIGR00730 family Rossman fold protein [Caulobacterales bacterium]